MENNIAVEVKNLKKTFGDVIAVDEISFTVKKGEICGYLGPNGAGKSTTVKILTGILKADSGEASISGFDCQIDSLETKKKIGYVPESGALYEALTPIEYLTFVGGLYHIDEYILQDKIGKFLKLFQLTEQAKERLSGFSKGMKQKVAIISSLLHDPEVLFLDEPFNGLDANTTFVLKGVIRELSQQGKTILFCSHILDVVEKLCHRVIIINKGKIVADGDIEIIRSQSGNKTLEEIFRVLTSSDNLADVTEEFLRAIRTS